METTQPRYRIRKLTPRECFRLMDVDDDRIDTLINSTETHSLKSGERTKPAIPKSQCYKLAGNSIVVSCLYHIFRKMFIDTDPPARVRQMTIFDML